MDNPLVVTLFVAAAVAAMILLKRLTNLSVGKALELIKAGAVIVDVRTAAEYRSDSLRGTVNIPLNDLESRIGSVVSDKGRPVLLHCRSGGRSAVAQTLLRRNGYRQAYNLGSIGRARRLLAQARK